MIYFPVRSILQNDKNRNYLPEDILIAVGVGSALFHYHNSFITALFDELGMLLFTLTLSNLAFQNKFIRISSAIICAIVMILKLCGMSSKQFSVAFAIYAVYVGVLGVLNKIISYKLALKLIGIAVIRQITEDYCLDMPIIISLLGHPAWHIFIAKFAVELADHIYSYVLFSKLIIKID
jgi:TctA family transporter